MTERQNVHTGWIEIWYYITLHHHWSRQTPLCEALEQIQHSVSFLRLETHWWTNARWRKHHSVLKSIWISRHSRRVMLRLCIHLQKTKLMQRSNPLGEKDKSQCAKYTDLWDKKLKLRLLKHISASGVSWLSCEVKPLCVEREKLSQFWVLTSLVLLVSAWASVH